MKNIRFDSVLLFALVIPFIMTYRIGPQETPFWLFGLIFLGLLVYLVLDILKIKERIYFKLKQTVLWSLIIAAIGSAFISAIIVRHETHPIYMIHDIVLQQEAAIRFLLDGKNPYAVTYFGTPLEEWHYSDKEINPALYHFVMQPFYILFALPFYFLSNFLIGYFDGRIPLLFLFFAVLILAALLVKDSRKKLLFIILLAFNPAMLPYTLEGRSDIFMFAFLFAGLFLLHKKQYLWAGVPIGFAFAVKQSVWPILPFYVAFLYFKAQHLEGVEVAASPPSRWVIKMVTPFILTFFIIVFPFFLWDQKAFLDSTIFYLSGNVPYGYPISGYGLGVLLNQTGVIESVNHYYPFWIWQLIIGLPVLTILVLYLKKNPTVGRLILIYGIFLFVFWYLSRYFNNNHLGYLSVVFITAYFWPESENKK